MKDAFELAQAGLDALNDIRDFYAKSDQSNPTPIEQAQLDLLSYLFSSAHPFDPNDKVFRQLLRTFGLILLFRDNPESKPTSRQKEVVFLPGGGFIVYC